MTSITHDPSELLAKHERYLVQAQWTSALRSRILDQISLHAPMKLLEVGSGTGAITQSIQQKLDALVYGIDIDPGVTSFAREYDQSTCYTVADGHLLPFLDNIFDAVYSHFLMLWVRDPAGIVDEMTRIVKPGGWVIAFAEPDYGSRIDYPEEMEEIGSLQSDALSRAGAKILIGRKIRALLSKAGLEDVTAGVLGGEWNEEFNERLTDSEWETLKTDLGRSLSVEEIEQLEELDRNAWRDQTRVLFVPTFYAYGRVRAG